MDQTISGASQSALRTLHQASHAVIGAAAAFLVFCSPTVSAQPIISGNQIQVPENGWYQVQDVSDFEEICGGLSACDVSDGTYHVINHSTGERFENIVVPEVADGISINGNRITWPDNGWYQVQDASTFEEICGGVAFCDVPDGVYIVINHDTGVRFSGVEIPQVNVSTDNDVVVTGNRISWPDNGWYQVQDSETFEEICAGVLFCDVSDGNYIVINHTTGRRFEDVVVGGGANPTEVIISSSNAMEIWREVVAVINEDRINELFLNLENELNVMDRELSLANTTDEIVFTEMFEVDPPYLFQNSLDSINLVPITTGSSYACSIGGDVTSYMGATGFDNVFEQCALEGSVYDGMTGSRQFFADDIRSQPWEDFSRTTTDGDLTRLSGRSFGGNLSLGFVNRMDGWDDLEFLQTIDNEEFSLNGYSVTRTSFDSEFAAIPNIGQEIDGVFVPFLVYELEETISGSFSVSALWTGSVDPLNVDIELRFQDNVVLAFDDADLLFPARDPEQPFVWEEGIISISASDGSSLTVTPSEAETGSFALTLSDGTTVGTVPSVDEFEVRR